MHPEEREAWARADARLAELLELPEADRLAALAERESDAGIRSRVETLLRAEEAHGPLDRSPDWPSLLLEVAPEEAGGFSLRGRRFGAYELEEEIGRGGMAVVYSARRADGAFAQSVAVKVLGTGLLPTSALQRFRREQELLARLRHPRIATLLDGGVAADGTPFLVMERIAGRPIDRYADEEHLDIRERLGLLLQVAEAVAFAHRNLVVHRDLKPGNILVDDSGSVKLLDFGIAKLVDPASETAAPTELRSRMLTPRYAAPEQVDGGPVTTATDVFGLGKVLERLLGERRSEIDLLNILRRATHSEPDRRYVDARAFAEDLERYLTGLPVVATPDRWSYRAGKWARRNRAALAVALLVLASITAGVAIALTQARRAAFEARNAAAVNDFLTGLFQAYDPDRAGGDDPPASELFRRGAAKARAEFTESPALQAELLATIGRIQIERGLYDDAETSLGEALRLRTRLEGEHSLGVARIRGLQADIHLHRGDRSGAIALTRQALATFARQRPASDPERRDLAVSLAEFLAVDGQFEAARTLSLEVLAQYGSTPRSPEPAHAAAYQTLGISKQGLGDAPGAVEAFERAVTLERERPGASASDLAIFLNDLGLGLIDIAAYDRAERAFVESLAIKRRLLGDRHIQTIAALSNLGWARVYQERFEEGIAGLREASVIARELFPAPHVERAEAIGALASALRRAGRNDEALALFEETLALSRSVAADRRSAIYSSHVAQFGALLLALERPREAERALAEAIALYEASEGQGGLRLPVALARHAQALEALGRPAEAADELARALPRLAATAQGWGSDDFPVWSLAAVRTAFAAGRVPEARRWAEALRRRSVENASDVPPYIVEALATLEAELVALR